MKINFIAFQVFLILKVHFPFLKHILSTNLLVVSFNCTEPSCLCKKFNNTYKNILLLEKPVTEWIKTIYIYTVFPVIDYIPIISFILPILLFSQNSLTTMFYFPIDYS